MQGFTFDRNGLLYKFLTFESWQDARRVYDTCSLFRMLIWVSVKISIWCGIAFYLAYSCVFTSIVTGIGLYHGLDFGEAMRMAHPAFGVPALLILIIMPSAIGITLIFACIGYGFGKLVHGSGTFKQSLENAIERSDFGKVLMSKANRICVPVTFANKE